MYFSASTSVALPLYSMPASSLRYGIGYHMTVVKEQHCDSVRVAGVVKSMVTKAKQVSDIGAELSFILPSASTAQFPALFDTMEGRSVCLSVCGRLLVIA